jgi:hypothetical protein
MPLQEDSYLQIYWKPLPGKTTKPSSLANLLLPESGVVQQQISTIPIPIPPSKL